MKTNSSSLFRPPEIIRNQTYRDYPIHEESLILDMADVLWTPSCCSDALHCHNCMEIGLCLEGSGVILIPDKNDRSFRPGSVVIIPKGVYHGQRNAGESSRWRYIAVNEDLLTQDAPARCRIEISRLLRRAQSSGIFLPEHALTKDVACLIQRMFELKCSSTVDALAELESIVLLILSRIARDQDVNAALSDGAFSNTHAIDPALLLVSESYRQDIKVVQMARACAMSESHFRKVFVQHMGVAPLEYLNRYRIKRAMYLLQTTAAPISQIAEECGFPTVTTFNRNFQRYCSLSPSRWRNENTIHSHTRR